MKLFSSRTDARSDADLLEAIQNGNDSSLIGVLFSRYMHLVYGLCLKYLKNREDAQDAVMEIFESMGSKLLVSKVQHFKSWLYMVSKNHCLMQLRKASSHEKINGSFMENDVIMHPIEEESKIDEDLSALEKCLQQLRADQQQCVRLFYLKEHSYEEVSSLTSFALKKVKSYIQNGKRNLKICLEKSHVS